MPAEDTPRFEIVEEHPTGARIEVYVNGALIFRGPDHVALRVAAKASEQGDKKIMMIPLNSRGAPAEKGGAPAEKVDLPAEKEGVPAEKDELEDFPENWDARGWRPFDEE